MLLGIPFVEVALAFTALLVAIFYFRNKKDPRYPPGPPSLPIIGNLLQLGSKPQETLLRWAEEYGPAFSMKMGSEDVIVLNDYKMIRDVFQETVASGRTPNPVFLAIGGGNYGIALSEGMHWEQQRRFALRKLRDQGFSKSQMESAIVEEAESMIRYFEKRVDQPMFGNRIFNGAVVNALWNIMSGEKQEWDAPDLPEMIKCADQVMKGLNRTVESGLYFAPFLRFIAPDFCGWTTFTEGLTRLEKLGKTSVQRHIQELDPNNPQDFIDHYVIEQQNTEDPTSSFYKETGDKNLASAITDLFLAGSETTSHTLSWAMLMLAHHPVVQEKLQKEIDAVIGQNRPPTLSDKPDLPYTEAVIMEVLRRSSVANNGVPRRMLHDAVFHGYFYPKNTTVMHNTFYVHNDPKVWGDPENFRPERFLSPDGLKIVKHDALIPFSFGKRQCPGYGLANDTLFLFLAGIFQKFQVKPDPSDSGNAVKNLIPKAKILNEPEPFKIIVSLR